MKSVVKASLLRRLQLMLTASYAPADATRQFIYKGDFGLKHRFLTEYEYRYCYEEMKAIVRFYRDCLAGKMYIKPDVAQKLYALTQGRIVPLEECKDVTADELLPIHRKGFLDAFYLPELKDVPIETFFDVWDYRDRQYMFTPSEDSLLKKFCDSFTSEYVSKVSSHKVADDKKADIAFLSQTYGYQPDRQSTFGSYTFRYAALSSNLKSELVQTLTEGLNADKVIVDSDAIVRIDLRARPFITYARGFTVRRKEQTYITARVIVDPKVIEKGGVYLTYGHRTVDYTLINPFEVREG